MLDITSPDLACNRGGEKAAALIADAEAGDVVKLTMNTWPCEYLIISYSLYAQFSYLSYRDLSREQWTTLAR